MPTLLSHVTPEIVPLGVSLLLAGVAVGIGISWVGFLLRHRK